MVVFDVGQTVAHGRFAGPDGFGPHASISSQDRHFAGDQVEVGIHHQFRSGRAGAQLRGSEIEIVLLLELVIREFISHHHSDAPRHAGAVDDIDAGDLGFLAAVRRVSGEFQRLHVSSQDGASAFVKPLRRHAARTGSGPAALHTPLIHAHAVGHLLADRMHRLPVGGAANVAETRAADHAIGGLAGVIDRRQYPPLRFARIDLRIIDRLRGEIARDGVVECDTRAQRSRRQIVDGAVRREQA